MDFFVWQRTCVDDAGNVLASASVTVKDVVSGALAQLYSDSAGSVGIGNPITADSEGFVQFYVKAGFYNITATSGSSSRTWTREAIGAPHPRTTAEISAGVTPVDYRYPEGNLYRYGENTTPGTTDMGAAVGKWIDVGMQGVDLILPLGDVLCTTWTEKSITSPLRIRGPGKELATLIGPDTATNFLSAASSVDIQGVGSDNWRAFVHIPNDLSADIEHVILDDVKNTDSIHLIEKTRLSTETQKVKNISIQNCFVDHSGIADETATHAIYIRGPYETAIVQNNTILNVNGNAIQLGDNFFAMQDLMTSAKVIGNHCENMNSPTGVEAHGVLVYGYGAVIAHNTVKGVTTVDNSDGEGIYTKVRYGVIAHNVLTDASDGQGAINVKGNLRSESAAPQGFATSVLHNKILFTAGSTTAHGINIENEDVEIAFNTIEGADRGINTGSFVMDNISIHHNTVLNTEGTFGIRLLNGGASLSCCHNRISGVKGDNATVGSCYGIFVQGSSALDGVEVSDNRVTIGDECNATTSCQAIHVNRNNATDNVEISRNKLKVSHASITEYGVRIEGTAASDDWHIKDNKWLDVDGNLFTTDGNGLPTSLNFDNLMGVETSDDTATNIIILNLPDNSAYSFEANVVAMETDGSDRALYKTTALVYRDGGGATVQGDTADIITDIESDANWNFNIGVTTNAVRMQCVGEAETDIRWRARVCIMSA